MPPQSSGSRAARSSRPWFYALALLCVLPLLSVLFPGCGKSPESPKTTATAPQSAANVKARTLDAKSADCRSCHEEIYKAWSASHHAFAHRTVSESADADAFGHPQEFSLHGVDYRIEWKDGRPSFTEKRPANPASPSFHYTADFALGFTPLRQYIVPTEKGRYQAADLAFDPHKKDWFNVFGDERRQPGEWGHWRGRGMNWNSMCAHCHNTAYEKNYNAVTDTYTTKWKEHGVGCLQCHTLPADHAKNPQPKTQNSKPKTDSSDLAALAATRHRAMETCAPCHARNELLTGDVRPGVAYNDHYRLTLPTDPTVFYPDGQVRDEVFNYTSLLTSRMGGKAGVTCLECHDPHSGKTLLPAQNNALCLQCHGAAGGRFPTAPVIDPLAHSHHPAGSTGNQCVTCHMPTTTYMQRDPRHDHGFTKPDPLLTKEFGIPNACNRCHTDKPVDWAIEHSEKWYGAKLNNRQRERTRLVAAAQAHKPEAADKLLTAIATEDIPAWKATLLLLARNYVATDPRVLETARAAAADADPLVRSAAAQVISSDPRQAPTLRPLLNDASRLVRLDAAWPLSPELPENSANRKELDAYLAVSADQPAGRMRIGQDLFNRGRAAEAETQLRLATQWDPNSAGIHDALGLVLNELGRADEAAASLWRAARLDPANEQSAFNAALAFAQAGKLADAELALRETIKRNPRFDRAHYNLALLLNQTNRAPEALAALETAERLAPNVPDYPYARATILWQRGDRPAAQAAARRTLELDPNHPQARQLLR